MHNRMHASHRWGLILAGGEGVRLKPLTRFVSGDDRPKQFCRLVGGQTLLHQTRVRIAPSVDPDQTLFLLTQAHERFYTAELADVPEDQRIVQPENRGTLPAILCGMLRIARADREATVAVFPSDHHYPAEARFIAGVQAAWDILDAEPDSVILFGSAARHAETAYGWIEPETEGMRKLPRVRHFWEKPSVAEAHALFEQRCLWNTFVMVGRVQAFLAMMRRAAPNFYEAFTSLPGDRGQAKAMAELYSRIQPRDFSTQVLSTNTDGLSVLSLGDVGWSDLGDPGRVASALSLHALENPWMVPWHRSAASGG